MSLQHDSVIRRPESTTPPVLLSVPADKDYVVLIRSAVGHLGARIGLTMEELGDLRLAVSEACALLLLPDELDATSATLECRFAERDGGLSVAVAADAEREATPQVGGFGWNLLEALVDELEWSNVQGRAEVRLVKRPAALER
jgi:serine/threonine-protein kinase RsbW